MNAELIRLESQISHQESVIADLNETVIEQQRQLERLTRSHELLKQRLDELAEGGGENMPHTRPPHY